MNNKSNTKLIENAGTIKGPSQKVSLWGKCVNWGQGPAGQRFLHRLNLLSIIFSTFALLTALTILVAAANV